jgi:hypothetical protein
VNTERLGWRGAALAYLLGALAFWWPLPTRLATHVHGDRFDAWTTLWLMWHLDDRISAGELTAVTDRMLYPVGYNLWSFGHAALQLLGVGLMQLGVPLVLAYNLLLLFGLWSAALAAHGLGRELGGSHRAGYVAGVLFATSPYLYGEGAAGCIELVAAGLLPLHAWMLVRVARAPTVRRTLAAAGVLAMIGPFNWYYTLFAGMFGLMFAAWQALAGQRRAAVAMLASFALAGLVDAPLIPLVRRETPNRPPLDAALLQDPASWEAARALADARVPIDELDASRIDAYDAMQVAMNQTPLRSLMLARFTVNPLGTTPGSLAIVVGVAGALYAGRRAWGWLVLAGVSTVLTLGPWLMLDDTPPLTDWSATLPLPYGLAYENVPFFAKAYRPYRIGVIALMALAAAGSAGAASLPRRSGWAVAALGLVGFAQPFWAGDRPALRELSDASVPPIYDVLRDLPDGAVIELPLQYQPLSIANARLQYNQVAHGKPLLNCNQLIRSTELLAFRDYVAANGLLRVLLDAGRSAPPYRFTDADVGALLADGFRYLVVHRRVPVGSSMDAAATGGADRISQPAVDLLRDTFGPPAHGDADAWIFTLPGTWTDQGRTHTWDVGTVREVTLPLQGTGEAVRLQLPADGAAPIHAGPARSVSFWARGLPDAARGPSVRVRGQDDVAPTLTTDAWTFVEVPVTAEGPVDIAFVGPGAMLVDRVQVGLRADAARHGATDAVAERP